MYVCLCVSVCAVAAASLRVYEVYRQNKHMSGQAANTSNTKTSQHRCCCRRGCSCCGGCGRTRLIDRWRSGGTRQTAHASTELRRARARASTTPLVEVCSRRPTHRAAW